MKKIFYIFISTLFIFSCNKNNTKNENDTPTNQDENIIDSIDFPYKKEISALLKNPEYKNIYKCLDKTQGKDIIVTFGNTGSGKSTLLNFLMGHDLEPNQRGGYEVVKKKDNNISYFLASAGPKTITLFPEYGTGEDGTVYIDLPDLENETESINFLNAICIHNILTKAKSVKFIFVESQRIFTDAQSILFEKLLNTIIKMLPNPTLLQKSSLLVITKNFKEEVIKQIIIPHAKQEFYQIFPQETLKKKLIRFKDPENFKDKREESSDTENEDSIEENKKKQFNDKRFNHHKKKLKKRVQKKLANLKASNFPDINLNALVTIDDNSDFDVTDPEKIEEVKEWIKNYSKKQ